MLQAAPGSSRPWADPEGRPTGSWLHVCCTQLKPKNDFEFRSPVTSERVELEECIGSIQCNINALRCLVTAQEKELRSKTKKLSELEHIVGSQ